MQIFPPQKLRATMGVSALVIMFAPAIGPTLTGLLLAKLSWNWIFWSFAIILAIALAFAIFGLKNIAEITKPKVDFLSLVESVIGFGALVMGGELCQWIRLEFTCCARPPNRRNRSIIPLF